MKNKKYLKMFCLMIVLVLTLSLTFVQNTSYAKAEERLGQIVMLNGCGIIEASPDAVEMTFSIKHNAQDFNQTQQDITIKYNDLKNALTEIDNNIQVYITNSTIVPDHQNIGYMARINIMVKTNNLNSVDKIISTANEYNVNKFHGVNYILENKQELYNQALKLAKENCEQKMASINSDYKILSIKECNIYSFSKGEKDAKIQIEAVVSAIFTTDLKENIDNQIVNKYI